MAENFNDFQFQIHMEIMIQTMARTAHTFLCGEPPPFDNCSLRQQHLNEALADAMLIEAER